MEQYTPLEPTVEELFGKTSEELSKEAGELGLPYSGALTYLDALKQRYINQVRLLDKRLKLEQLNYEQMLKRINEIATLAMISAFASQLGQLIGNIPYYKEMLKEQRQKKLDEQLTKLGLKMPEVDYRKALLQTLNF